MMAKNLFTYGYTRNFHRNRMWQHRRFLPHKTLPRMLVLLWSLFFLMSGGYYIFARLRVFADAPLPPTHLVAVNDDKAATIRWNPSPDSDTVGYKVTWGDGNNTQKTLFTPYPDTQIQPLEDGKTYRVQVQSVNKNGHISTAIGPVFAQSDPSYVNKLKQEMTGMFDDFNDNMYSGLPNPTHWYTTANNTSPVSMAFVSGLQHELGIFVQSNQTVQEGERGSLTMRSLRQFDFTNRIGTIAFDFDWGQEPVINGLDNGTNQWSLTISPFLVDSINEHALYNGSKGIYPSEGFQVAMQGDTISLKKIVNGAVVNEWDSMYSRIHPIRDINVRKHSLLKINQDGAQLFIDGTQILSVSNIDLGFSKGWVYVQQSVLATPKAHVPFSLSQVDNIGFDAPDGYNPPVIHTYTAGGYAGSDKKTVDFFNNTATYTITIPDSTAGEQAERLFLDANLSSTNTPKVSVNGTQVTWPIVEGLSDNGSYDSRVFVLPPGTLHQGDNIVTISTSDTYAFGVENVHAEVEFPGGTQNSYTPYPAPFSGNAVEAKIPPVAPIPGFGDNAPQEGSAVSGSIPVEVVADGAFSLLPTGHVNPVTQVEVDVDGVPQTILTLAGPTVKTDQTLQLDTTKIPNGQHTLTVTAYGMDRNTAGTIVSMNSLDPLLQDNPFDNTTALRRIIFVDNGEKSTVVPSTYPQISPAVRKETPIPSQLPTVTPLESEPGNSSSSGILGLSTIGKVNDINDSDHITGSRFITGVRGGTVISMSVYVGNVAVMPGNKYQMAIYADENGKPGALLASTQVGTLTPNTWNSLPISAALQPHTAYWLVYNTNAVSSTQNNLVYAATQDQLGISANQPFGSFPEAITSGILGNWAYSIYVTYQATIH